VRRRRPTTGLAAGLLFSPASDLIHIYSHPISLFISLYSFGLSISLSLSPSVFISVPAQLDWISITPAPRLLGFCDSQ